MGRKLFCELGPAAYGISVRKGIILRHIKDFFGKEKIADTFSREELPCIVKGHSSVMVRRLAGVDIALQENKVTNIRIACGRINGIIIRPGETFSFWRTVGPATRKRGYVTGLVISGGRLGSGYGGGICQMANMIHWLVLNSPLEVTEIHHHSDAIFPDERRRVPFGTGTSVFYNYIDYRFRNSTDQRVQLLVWVEGGELCGELRSEREFPTRYRIVEEDHHYAKEGERYYRISRVYRIAVDKATNTRLKKELILDNHSAVLFDPALIPEDQIRNE